tara:strand:+ start:143 stop:397 length:255 start_codon:yes stop_codon:yes gene_type:complete
MFFYTLCPFNIFRRSARWTLLQILLQVFIAPFGFVRFVDFFIGDVLTRYVLLSRFSRQGELPPHGGHSFPILTSNFSQYGEDFV